MEIENPSEFISDIVEEIKKKEDISQMDNDELIKKAEKIRKQRIEQRKSRIPPEKEIEKTKEFDFEKALESLPSDEWTEFEITEELVKSRDLRKVFKIIAKNQPLMIRNIMEGLDWGIKKKSHTSDMVKLLEEMGLIEERKVLKIWAKDYAIKELGLKEKLEEIEQMILNKFDFWTKSVKEETRNKFIGVSGYWILTKKGELRVLLLADTTAKLT